MTKGRIPKPWHRKATDSWYVCLDGKQVPLGRSKREAHAEFARLTIAKGRGVEGGRITVRQLADAWLRDCERTLADATVENYRLYIESFCAVCGSLYARDLKPYHASQWADARKTKAGQPWARSTYHLAYSVLKVMTAWGEAKGYLDSDPLRRLKRPEMARRAPISPEEAEAIIAAVRPVVATALRLLLVTGLRPGELCSLDGEKTSLLVRRASVVGKTGHRVIPLSDAAIAILEPLLRTRPAGPLLTGDRGKRLTPGALQQEVIRARRRAGLGEHITPHCFRGLFSTEALRRGVDSALVSKLLGHKDPSVLMKHYASPDSDMMLDAANRATDSGKKSSSSSST
jgi:integrase